MKKIITTTLTVIFILTFVSCKKEDVQQPISPAATLATTSVAITGTTLAMKSISSDWLRLSFSEVYSTPTTGNFVFQLANYMINPAIAYNPGIDVALAYVKIQGSNGNNYYRIPGLVATTTQNLDMSFWMNPVSFNVSIYNADDHSLMPDAALFPSYRFRYIVILRTTYESLNIDWNNYYAVAAALNISL